MTIQLLTNEATVKSILGGYLSLNVAGEYLSTAMIEAQEIGLKSILGSRLLKAMKEKEAASTLSGIYADLKDEIQMYLAYKTVAQVLPLVAYKTGNAGVVQTSDTNMTPVSKDVLDSRIEEVNGKADYFCYELQRWLLANAASISELGVAQCNEIHANLRSMASCGIFLGGARGVKEGGIINGRYREI